MLEHYRTAIDLRRDPLTPAAPTLQWLLTDPELLSFTRPCGFTFLANLSGQAVALPPAGAVLIASGPLPDGFVPPVTAVGLRATGLGRATHVIALM